jgi:hypothetical protein
MGLKIWVAGLCAAAIAVAALTSASAEPAQKKRVVAKQSARQVVANQPRSRVTVQPRSFLDPGPEILPGERKFNDYAIPPGYSPLQVLGPGRDFRRQPLPDPWDFPGSAKW